jgi:hypothetical protein
VSLRHYLIFLRQSAQTRHAHRRRCKQTSDFDLAIGVRYSSARKEATDAKEQQKRKDWTIRFFLEREEASEYDSPRRENEEE